MSSVGEVAGKSVSSLEFSVFRKVRGGLAVLQLNIFPNAVILAGCILLWRPFMASDGCSFVVFFVRVFIILPISSNPAHLYWLFVD